MRQPISRRLVAVILTAAALSVFSSVPALAQNASSCTKTFHLTNGTLKTYAQCQSLPVQGASIAWDYFPGVSTINGSASDGIFDLAFRNTLLDSGGWAGWGINPTALKMAGSSVLIAFTNSSAGSVVLPYNLDNSLLGGTSDLATAAPNAFKLATTATPISVEINATTLEATIFATLSLKPGQTVLNQVWNKGTTVTGQQPQPHDTSSNTYITSLGTIDITTGTIVAGSTSSHQKNRHAIISAVAWGILLPIGVISARYMRPFNVLNPSWFYVHVICQVCGYTLGVAGWALGIKLIHKYGTHLKHRNIGISLFVLAAVQMLALILRPKPGHATRKYWNVYHYAIGYAIIILSIINIFEGFDLLRPAKAWKHAYLGVIIALGAIAFVLEILTWAVWLQRRARTRPQRVEDRGRGGSGAMNGVNDGNGHKLEDREL